MTASEDHPPNSEFWGFSLEFYGRPGVAAACLDLQDRHGRDVNLVLFACWLGLSGRGRLSPAALAAADATLRSWRGDMIEPLRALRRRAHEAADAGALYAALQAAELSAEHVAQARLEALAPAVGAAAETRVADALANLALYLDADAAAAAEPIRNAIARVRSGRTEALMLPSDR